MLMQDMLTGYLHEVPDSQLYEYNEVVYDGLGNPVGIAPLIMAALPALMPMLSNILKPAAPPSPALLPPPVQALPLPPPEPPPILPRPPEPSFQPPMPPPPYPMSPVPGEFPMRPMSDGFPMRPMPDGFPIGPNTQPGMPGPGHPFAARRYRPRLRRRKKEMTNASSRPFYR
jgi:hypothetical protein